MVIMWYGGGASYSYGGNHFQIYPSVSNKHLVHLKLRQYVNYISIS